MTQLLPPSLVAALSKRLISPEYLRQASAQSPLALLRDMSRQARAGVQTVRGPRGEVYMFPTESTLTERAAWEPLREAVEEGIVRGPDRQAKLSGELASSKARDSARLANAIIDGALPRKRLISPVFDVLSLNMDDAGRARAAATYAAPSTTGHPGAGILYDLSADPGYRGGGYDLLRANLDGPMLPDASEFWFTPLPGAKKFYTHKFGMKYMDPYEALSDPDVSEAFRAVGGTDNVKDLGVGVIRRAAGGLAQMRGRVCR